jgi:hypothetical protein
MKCVRQKAGFANRFNLIRLFNPSRENNPLASSGKSVASIRASCFLKEGRCAIVTSVGSRMRWTR